MSEFLYNQVKEAVYMCRLLRARHYNFVRDDCLQFFEALGGNIMHLINKIIEDIKTASNIPKRAEIIKYFCSHEFDSWDTDDLTRVILKFEQVKIFAVKNMIKICEDIAAYKAADAKNYEFALRNIKRIFGLSRCALELLEFGYLYSTDGEMSCYLSNMLEMFKSRNKNILACILDVSLAELIDAANELESMKILELYIGTGNHSGGLNLNDTIIKIFDQPKCKPKELFCVEMKGDTLPLENFNIQQEELEYIIRLLKLKISEPVHIMLYGAPGTGKTTFARSLSKALGLKAFTINVKSDETSASATSVIACMNIASRHPGSFVVVDEAEKILDTSLRDVSSVRGKDKLWLNTLLEKPNNHVIWITNHVNNIHPSVMRRFAFSVFFQAPGRREREKLFAEIIERRKLTKYFDDANIKSLAKNYEVPAAVIEDSLRRAKSLKYSHDEFASAVEASMKAYTSFLRGGAKMINKAAHEVKNFTLDGIALDGTAISDLMNRCSTADKLMRDSEMKTKLEGGCATMLFYGPPGTGKTALARHIAHELDRECFIQRASDLTSCYVGETEKKIAEAFRHAEEEDAVLVIDEADTFLYSRDMAVRSWEVSFINEFLVNLEDCKCFCICTTNRLQELDAAALRRFSYKIKFDYSKPPQIFALYNSLLAPLCSASLAELKLTHSLARELKSFDKLTPGDFHAVRVRYNSVLSSDNGSITHEMLINDLRREMLLKHEKTSAGFKL